VLDKYKNIDGYNIRYRDTEGDGPVLFMTHGIGASLETWDLVAERLPDTVRVISWDVVNHGLSDFSKQPYGPDDYATLGWSLLNALGVSQVSLMGNSMGGAISIRMLSLAPERVTHIALLNAATLGVETPMPFRLMTLPILSGLLSKPGKIAIDNQIKAIFHSSYNASIDVKKVIHRNVMRDGAQKAFADTLKVMTNIKGQKRELVEHSLSILSSTSAPVLFIHGQEDSVIPIRHSIEAAAQTSNAEMISIDQCGHTPQLEMPQKIVDSLMPFIADTMPESKRAVGPAPI
jgi:Predicted hydrolases or acyltransferases (alpha/beta hydrolase superfamily)